MNKPDEYRTNAWECERMAENSLNPSDKDAWLQIANGWAPPPSAGAGSSMSMSAARLDPLDHDDRRSVAFWPRCVCPGQPHRPRSQQDHG
jgi:hypothetical protein